MIIVTGGAGFIGSNLVKALNASGHNDIVVVDDMTDGKKYQNIVDCVIEDYLDKDEFRRFIDSGCQVLQDAEIVFHQGACSETTVRDGRFMLENNYSYSKLLFELCQQNNIPFIYASSAAVYGTARDFAEQRQCEAPINIYGYSKYLFDEYVRRRLKQQRCQTVGLRYFNVYGPNEQHKGQMASVAYHLNRQLLETGKICLFEGSDGYTAGEQRRDFIHVDDVVAANIWFMQHPDTSGIFNIGTGNSRSFNELARAVIAWHGRGTIEYIPFPDGLRQCYQSFTEADIAALRDAGYAHEFYTLEQGINRYLDYLNSHA